MPQVQKPARYIGCEDGMQAPEHGPEKTSWLFTYPDTYEIGLLNEPRVLRVHQWITTDDGERHDPMSVAAAASAPVGVA